MSPIDRAFPVPRSRLTPISFVKIAMCSYEIEKTSQSYYRDLGVYLRTDTVTGDENFRI